MYPKCCYNNIYYIFLVVCQRNYLFNGAESKQAWEYLDVKGMLR